MTLDDAAELGAYAQELFRFASGPQVTRISELMVPLIDQTEDGKTVRPALEIGKALLRDLATKTEDGRIVLSDVARAVNEELRRLGIPPIDHVEERRRAERRERHLEESQVEAFWSEANEWAGNLSSEEVGEFTAQALQKIVEPSREFFKDKTILTSKTLLGHAFTMHSGTGMTR